MHRSEEDVEVCADCGAVVRDGDRSFRFSEAGVLCAECTIRRGGVYEALRDAWSEEPSLEGLDLSD